MDKIFWCLLKFSVKMLHILFEAPKYLNSHFSKCKRAFFGISGVTPCEQCTDGQMDMKVYEKLLHRQKMKSYKRFFR